MSDLSEFDTERDVFAGRAHELFVEVKYVGHSSKKWAAVSRRTIAGGVRSDLERLVRNLDKKRCTTAALLLIDDNSYLEGDAGIGMPWSPRVTPLLASPTQLARTEWARKVGVVLPASCPRCGSPRVAPIVFGMPTPELEAAATRQEVICGGCELLGFDLDPTFRCLDCRFADLRFDPERDAYPPVGAPDADSSRTKRRA